MRREALAPGSPKNNTPVRLKIPNELYSPVPASYLGV